MIKLFEEKVRLVNYLLSCKWCMGGTVVALKDGRRICINCGRAHDENGELITPAVATEKQVRKGWHCVQGN